MIGFPTRFLLNPNLSISSGSTIVYIGEVTYPIVAYSYLDLSLV